MATATTTGYSHIVLNERGVPMIAGTTTKVVEVVLDQLAEGWSAQEIHEQYPYLTLAQIHSALGYYWDHQEEIDQEIARQLEYVDAMQQAAPPSPLVERLTKQGLIK